MFKLTQHSKQNKKERIFVNVYTLIIVSIRIENKKKPYWIRIWIR